MAEQFDHLEPAHIDFIKRQHVFFVGTASAEGFINVSPKGLDTLRVKNPNRVTWLNLTGSGNETSAHVQDNGRMTLMFCSFERQPLILRLYGAASVVHPGNAQWEVMSEDYGSPIGARQVFDMQVDLVQTSCGYAVPYLEFRNERETLTNWAEKKGAEGIEQYWAEKNARSLNGKKIELK